MKILIAHNDYAKYSGEEAVVEKMQHIFSSLGHETAFLRTSTADARESLAGKIHTFFAGMYCPSGVRAMRDAIRREKPDLVNVHNLYPFISPAALRECKKAGIPVVMTVHNFRLICPTGLFMRDNHPCELCLNHGNEWDCVKYNCEHSLLKSTAYAARNAVARLGRHYRDCVDRFACITDFQRRKLTKAGFDPDKLTVIPNSVDIPDRDFNFQGNYVAYSGRLSLEKGIDLIIEAARRNPDIPFRLAGAVRDRKLVENLPANVSLTGYLSGKDLEDFYDNARFFVMASRCYEGFSMTILEAAGYGKPMIAPDHGGFTEIIGKGPDASGILIPPSDVDSLSDAVRSLWNKPDECIRIGKLARKKLKERYSTPVISKMWDELVSSF